VEKLKIFCLIYSDLLWIRRKPEEKLKINGPWTLSLTNIWAINMQSRPWALSYRFKIFCLVYSDLPWKRRKPAEKLEINGPWTLFLINIWTISMHGGPWTLSYRIKSPFPVCMVPDLENQRKNRNK
jgi:hypothetical protein